MFLFTGTSHFTSMKYDFAAMIPDPLPDGLWVIYLTGVFEIAGAIGLLIPQTRKLAGICLILLLVSMFSANVNAVLNDIPLGGQDPTPLWLRTPVQLLYIGMVWWTSVIAPVKEDEQLRDREPVSEQEQTPPRQSAPS
jgi:uncharacterized membrane protein